MNENVPIIATTRRIVELLSEDHDREQALNSRDEGVDVAHFSVISGIQEELIEFIRKKLNDSIELQQFIVSKEMEFLEKFVNYLAQQDDRGRYNNHNDLEDNNHHSELTPSERELKLNNARNRLNDLKVKLTNLLTKQQKACDYLSFGIEQIRIFNSFSSSTSSVSARHKITNSSWICSLNNSIILQRIRMICEKLIEVDSEMESSFWISEIDTLVNKLDQTEKSVAFGMIIEMAIWETEKCSTNHLVNLINDLLKKEDLKEEVFVNFEKVFAVEDQKIESYVMNTNVLSALFMKMDTTNQIYRDKFGQKICQLIIKTLENSELNENHLKTLIEKFEGLGPQLGLILNKFEKIFTLFESRIQMLEQSEQSRVHHLMRFRLSYSPLPISTLSAAIQQPRATVRNITVIEHSSTDMIHNPTIYSQERIHELEREIRMKIEKEFRIEELRRKEEEIERKEKELEERRRKDEEEKRKEKEIEEKRKKEEEEKRKEIEEKRRKDEEERKRRIEEENRKKLEDEARKAREMKLKEQQRAQEVENSRIAAERQAQQLRENHKKNNPCVFLGQVTLYRHACPSSTYTKDVLAGKIIGMYFSGHWCPPSRDFTPILRDFHAHVQDDFEILFFSQDQNEQEMQLYLQQYHGDWFHLKFGSVEDSYFFEQFQFTGIPSLAILKPNGTILSLKGREDVQYCQNPRALVNQWKSM